ncbi:MAG TPA: hypothetical protein VNJ01_01520 [Bacteriovoracaceae bacterium]|nr:hypothetical protein [Bacteriovoracaceae bacterium]
MKFLRTLTALTLILSSVNGFAQKKQFDEAYEAADGKNESSGYNFPPAIFETAERVIIEHNYDSTSKTQLFLKTEDGGLRRSKNKMPKSIPFSSVSGRKSTDVLVAQSQQSSLLKNILAVRVHLPNLPYPDYNPAAILFNSSNSLASFYREMSRGRMDITGSVHPEVIELAQTGANTNYCNEFWKINEEADVILRSKGVNLDAYTHVMYFTSAFKPWDYNLPGNEQEQGACSWRGRAEMPGRRLWFNGRTWDWQVALTHEFGHTLGLAHAGTGVPSAADYAGPALSNPAYLDLSDTMGAQPESVRVSPGFNAINKVRLNFISPEELLTATANGQTYTISTVSPPLATAGQPVTLYFKDQYMPEPMYLSYRQPNGFDASLDSKFFSTLSIHTSALDPVYPGNLSIRLANLSVGQTHLTPGGVKIKLINLSAQGATVRIGGTGNEENTCLPSAPTFSLSPIQLDSYGTATVQVSVKNNDGLYCNPSDLILSSAGSAQLSVNFSPEFLRIAPGDSQSSNLTVTHLSGTGNLSYTVNLSGHTSTVTRVSTVTVNQVANPCIARAPSLTLPANFSMLREASADTGLILKNQDSGACAAVPLTLNLQSAGLLAGEFIPATHTLAPGESKTVAMRIRHLNGSGEIAYSVLVKGHSTGMTYLNSSVTVAASSVNPNPVYTVSSPSLKVAPGGDLQVSWKVDQAAANDWVGLFKVGESNYRWFYHVNGLTSGTYSLKAPSEPGTYEFRYLLNNQFILRATSAPITVEASVSVATYAVSSSSLKVAPGGDLQVSWKVDQAAANDWVGLFKVGEANYRWFFHVNGLTSGSYSLQAPSEPGIYEFRYSVNNQYIVKATSAPITIEASVSLAPYTVSSSSLTVAPGADLQVNWKVDQAAANDWVGLFKVGENNYLWFSHVNGLTSGSYSLKAPSEPGTYEFRYSVNNQYIVKATSAPITVR